ncbi:MAG: IS66-like element accessory protein TnpA [Giesbergeria sp.]
MDTIVKTESLGRRHRRCYEPSFKADVVAACQQPGVSVAAVALNHGLNANLLRRWVAEHERFGHHALEHEAPPQRVLHPTPAAAFVPVKLPAPPAPSSANIQIEVRRGATAVSIAWPVWAAAECAAWLRELVQ